MRALLMSLAMLLGCPRGEARVRPTPPPEKGKQTAPPPPAPWIPGRSSAIAAACVDLAHASCARWQRCDPRTLEDSFATLQRCRLTVLASCVADRAFEESGFSAPSLSNCAQEISVSACGETWPACDRRGALPDGAPCTSFIQCQSGHCSSASCGTCEPPPKKLGLGATCNDIGDCEDDLTCGFGTCVKRAGLAEHCSMTGGASVAPECVTGARCDHVDFTCQRAYHIAVGAPCGHPQDCRSGAVCAGTCVLPPLLGETCTDACDTPLQCVSGVCILPAPVKCPH